MGNDNQKPGHHQKSTTDTQKKLTDNFKNFSGANGELSHTQFIKTLASMDEFKELANSPLVNRLFNVFDKDKSGQISQGEYLGGLQEILASDESKIKYTFLAFDKNNDDLVSLSEFVELFQEAWVQGFTLLQDSVQKKTSHGSNPNSGQIRDWAIKNKQVVADKVAAEFSRYSQNENMTFVQFREWIKTSSIKSVTAGFESIVFEIPLTLI